MRTITAYIVALDPRSKWNEFATALRASTAGFAPDRKVEVTRSGKKSVELMVRDNGKMVFLVLAHHEKNLWWSTIHQTGHLFHQSLTVATTLDSEDAAATLARAIAAAISQWPEDGDPPVLQGVTSRNQRSVKVVRGHCYNCGSELEMPHDRASLCPATTCPICHAAMEIGLSMTCGPRRVAVKVVAGTEADQ